jgi:hypothetical protein
MVYRHYEYAAPIFRHCRLLRTTPLGPQSVAGICGVPTFRGPRLHIFPATPLTPVARLVENTSASRRRRLLVSVDELG